MVAKVYEEMKDKEVGIKDTDINANIGDRDAKNDVNADALLKLKDFKVSFFTPVGEVKAVGGISYDLKYGEVMGIVGESDSGKSVEAYSIIGLLQSPAASSPSFARSRRIVSRLRSAGASARNPGRLTSIVTSPSTMC